MGLFDLFKKVSDLVEDLEEVSEKLKTAKDTFSQTIESTGTESGGTTTSWGYSFPEGYEFKPDHVRSRAELIRDMKQLILKNFPEYHVYHQVPAAELDRYAHPACAPINFLLEKDGRYALAIFIVSDRTNKSMNLVGTREVLASRYIPSINFWEEYANDDDYVVARIRYHLS